MKILILDNSRHRHAVFQERFLGQKVRHAYTVAELVKAMCAERFDVVYLDHDLGERCTGLDAALFIAGMSTASRPGAVVVHSQNVGGAAKMVRVLAAEGVPVTLEPFRG